MDLQRALVKPRSNRLALIAIRFAIASLVFWLGALCGGCTTEDPLRQYTCVVLYRCAGDENITARLALPCASSSDKAINIATDAGITEAETCPVWQYVRAVCSVYEPETTCAP